jgi:capsular polysaccharide biosynthesis protein
MLRRFRDIVRKKIPTCWADNLARFKVAYNLSDSKTYVIVVQDRGKGRSRSLLNHDELIESLRNQFNVFDRKVVVLTHSSEISAEDSVLMHYFADVIIGPHGAGLSLTMFARKGVGFIELHPRNGNVNGVNPNYCHR